MQLAATKMGGGGAIKWRFCRESSISVDLEIPL